MIVVIFELCILIVSLLFFSTIRPLVPGTNIATSIGIGLVIGLVDFFLTWFFAKEFDRSRRFMQEYHDSYHNASFVERYTWKPLLISVAEELFFRGLLAGLIGWLWSAVAFALIHALNFKDKTLTTVAIFCYGITFFIPLWLTGSLLGSIVAHYVFTMARIWYFPKHEYTMKKVN